MRPPRRQPKHKDASGITGCSGVLTIEMHTQLLVKQDGMVAQDLMSGFQRSNRLVPRHGWESRNSLRL